MIEKAWGLSGNNREGLGFVLVFQFFVFFLGTSFYSLGNFVFELGCLRMQPKVGGKLHLRLNTDTSPIADKYREGKLKRTPGGE